MHQVSQRGKALHFTALFLVIMALSDPLLSGGVQNPGVTIETHFTTESCPYYRVMAPSTCIISRNGDVLIAKHGLYRPPLPRPQRN
ncbi:hypothetical protein AAFF_G00347940 [Aldrovandia affinis]|uniref:Uncharacterized protein n=1 Tax=Aldrovandia affinis TaxID=143900 RepID=A0AAD7SM07_9TELE|nr:hypothetical protein AAFF_G00347940 [Aldrovandia affinis]